jgi:membrane-associated protease RseP (regulator of RpoE activity)
MTNTFRLAVILFLLRFHPSLGAATLTQETKTAWGAYLQAANAAMQARLQPGAHFLWLDDEPGRAEDIRTKGLYIAQVGPHVPKKVPSGLIHDWLGVGFVPNVRIEDILLVVRDYDRYKDVYRPGVLDSISHGTDGVKDLFSMRLVNKSVVPKTALDQSLREFPTMEPESKGLTRNRKPCLPI